MEENEESLDDERLAVMLINAERKERIQLCKDRVSFELFLSWEGGDCEPLSQIPDEIFDLNHIQQFAFDSHQLIDLDPRIGQLLNLTHLSLSANKLSKLPPQIGLLKNLRVLVLEENLLSCLPPEIGDLVSLNRIYLQDNLLQILPLQIGKLVNLLVFSMDLHLQQKYYQFEMKPISRFLRELWGISRKYIICSPLLDCDILILIFHNLVHFLSLDFLYVRIPEPRQKKLRDCHFD